MLKSMLRGRHVLASPVPLASRLPDDDDEPFLEVAVAARAAFLVTGNGDHYPPDRRCGARVVAPREFVNSAQVRSSGLLPDVAE